MMMALKYALYGIEKSTNPAMNGSCARHIEASTCLFVYKKEKKKTKVNWMVLLYPRSWLLHMCFLYIVYKVNFM